MGFAIWAIFTFLLSWWMIHKSSDELNNPVYMHQLADEASDKARVERDRRVKNVGRKPQRRIETRT